MHLPSLAVLNCSLLSLQPSKNYSHWLCSLLWKSLGIEHAVTTAMGSSMHNDTVTQKSPTVHFYSSTCSSPENPVNEESHRCCLSEFLFIYLAGEITYQLWLPGFPLSTDPFSIASSSRSRSWRMDSILAVIGRELNITDLPVDKIRVHSFCFWCHPSLCQLFSIDSLWNRACVICPPQTFLHL